MNRRPTHRPTVVALCLLAALAACSSSGGKSAAGPAASGDSATATTTAAPATGPGLHGNAPCAVSAAQARVPETTSLDAKGDATLTSFDGTHIRIHWFPQPGLAAGARVPTVLMGPGWSLPGDTDTGQTNPNGGLLSVYGVNIPTLWQQGYNVLTWDPRGFGASDGTVEVDHAEHEGKDVQRLLSWVAAQPQTLLDAKADPRVGMVGGSYGGGIQLVTAAIDCRVDAIVPEIAWNSLVTSLYKAETVKSGWAGFLFALAASRQLDPLLRTSYQQSATGRLSPESVRYYQDRGMAGLIDKVRAPTLLLQGTVDTLFTLDEAVRNLYEIRKHAPAAMLWFCGGHGFCLTDPGDRGRITQATFSWLQRYLKLDASAPAQPEFETVDQNGARFTAASFPPRSGQPITADGAGPLAPQADGGAGPATVPPGNTEVLAAVTSSITPARAGNAVNVPVSWAERDVLVVGAPELTFSYTGTAATGDKPTRVFAQLVDDTTGLVLGNQITPIEVTLDGRSHTTKVPLEMIAFSARPGASVTLQLVATTVVYAQPQLGGHIDFDRIHIELPVVEADPG